MFLQSFKKFDFGKPNLLSVLPVEILDNVFASTPGLSLIPIEVIFFNFFDILLINFASLSDSILINNIFFFIAR